jgi:homoserine kinase
MTARVRVPASSSNLGSGFDCVGVAVDRWLVASVTLGGIGIAIQRSGTLSAVRARADQDLFTRGFRAACATGGATSVGARIEATSDIPVGCGLGSSAAAIVAGALLADAALELGLSRAQILEIARHFRRRGVERPHAGRTGLFVAACFVRDRAADCGAALPE